MSEQDNVNVDVKENEAPQLESATKEYEDALYLNKDNESPEVDDEKKAEPSEDHNDDGEVTKGEDDKSSEKPEKDDQENSDDFDYELSVEGESFVKGDSLKEIEAFAKENKLSKDAAMEIVNRQNEAIAEFIEKHESDLDAQIDNWRLEVESDSVLGGENFERTKSSARKAVERFGDEGFIEILNTTGYGNNPSVVRFLANIGELLSEDSLVAPGKQQQSEKPLYEYFYGN